MIPPAKQKVVGIDVSKDFLAISYLVEEKVQHLEEENTKAGFRQLIKECGTESLYVMEAKPQIHGIRSVGLASTICNWLTTYLSKARKVGVVNPVIIKRYIQMHLGKGKSGKKDAQWIRRYGEQNQMTSWQPE
ncbi:IS110 family transposase [Adhaeribacter radiodurans]|uniref:Transposase n=1 Tax=Adhaeribacter radiodurans TaxID=2745197 RepID=A0A7L7L5X1_9BACT|nr:transposase [Adhaeribacter radiodurans]QMU28173.1 transposase [Adhaeribacter radiodurans]